LVTPGISLPVWILWSARSHSCTRRCFESPGRHQGCAIHVNRTRRILHSLLTRLGCSLQQTSRSLPQSWITPWGAPSAAGHRDPLHKARTLLALAAGLALTQLTFWRDPTLADQAARACEDCISTLHRHDPSQLFISLVSSLWTASALTSVSPTQSFSHSGLHLMIPLSDVPPSPPASRTVVRPLAAHHGRDAELPTATAAGLYE
jgi:hypothetical protein